MPSLLTVIGIAVVVPLAIFLQAFVRRHWYFAKINAARDFSHEANYMRKTLPITYYEVGHLSDVLKGWHGTQMLLLLFDTHRTEKNMYYRRLSPLPSEARL